MDLMRELGSMAFASRLRRLSDRLKSEATRLYQSRGIDFNDSWFLIAFMLSKREGITIKEVSDAFGISHSAISQMASAMKREKFIESRQDARDRRRNLLFLTETLSDPTSGDKNTAMARFGDLISKADSYDPLPHKNETLECQYDVYHKVWDQASKLRSSGELLKLGSSIQCPVVAVHGDYDPHPAEGVKGPLSCILKDFRFMLLEKCGHMPWIERLARDRFYGILKTEAGS